jgi:hypothetical protein
VRVKPTFRPTFETGLGAHVERQEHAPHPLQIPSKPDPTPGVPPLSQIWDPSFLHTYDFGRWTMNVDVWTNGTRRLISGHVKIQTLRGSNPSLSTRVLAQRADHR